MVRIPRFERLDRPGCKRLVDQPSKPRVFRRIDQQPAVVVGSGRKCTNAPVRRLSPPRIVRESPVVTQYGADIGIPRQHPGVGQEAAVHRAAHAQSRVRRVGVLCDHVGERVVRNAMAYPLGKYQEAG